MNFLVDLPADVGIRCEVSACAKVSAVQFSVPCCMYVWVRIFIEQWSQRKSLGQLDPKLNTPIRVECCAKRKLGTQCSVPKGGVTTQRVGVSPREAYHSYVDTRYWRAPPVATHKRSHGFRTYTPMFIFATKPWLTRRIEHRS